MFSSISCKCVSRGSRPSLVCDVEVVKFYEA